MSFKHTRHFALLIIPAMRASSSASLSSGSPVSVTVVCGAVIGPCPFSSEGDFVVAATVVEPKPVSSSGSATFVATGAVLGPGMGAWEDGFTVASICFGAAPAAKAARLTFELVGPAIGDGAQRRGAAWVWPVGHRAARQLAASAASHRRFEWNPSGSKTRGGGARAYLAPTEASLLRSLVGQVITLVAPDGPPGPAG